MLNRRGQTSMEMALLWAVVVAALVYMMAFFGRHVKGNVMNQAKTVSNEPWGESAVYTADSTSTSTTNSSSTQSTTDSNSNSTSNLNLGAVP